MEITFAPRGIIQIDDARLIFRNFSGRGNQYNHDGDRNFCIVIPNQEIADELIDKGFNVKIKPPREDGADPFMYLKVNVKYHPKDSEWERLNPIACLITGKARNVLKEENINILDGIDIAKVDLDISGSNWEVNGKSGRSAYLSKIYVTQEVDRFLERYAEEECPEEYPFT